MRTSSLESVLQRDRFVVGVALAAIVFLSWFYILAGAGMGMTASHMSALPTAMQMSAPMAAMQPMPWTIGYASLVFVMWWLMMLATMLPSAAPLILLFAALARKHYASGAPYAGTAVFVSGYLAVWGGFSVLAVALQWQLDRITLLSPLMVTTSLWVGALLLIGAGIWQFTPLKQTCLRHCRSPVEFLTHHWRDGEAGALQMGIRHGAYCLGCCWMIMLLLFFGGIMNIYWIAGLTTLVLVEKITPVGLWVSGLAGGILIAWGGTLLVSMI